MAKKEKEADYSGVLFIRNLPVEVKRQFKMKCLEIGMTMTEAVELFMRDVVSGEHKLG